MGLLFDINQTLQQTYSPTTYEKFSTFSPVYSPAMVYQLDYAYAPVIALESPNTSGSSVSTKKEANQSQETRGSSSSQNPTTSPSLTAGGSDWAGLVLVLGLVAIGGYVLVGMTKKKKTE